MFTMYLITIHYYLGLYTYGIIIVMVMHAYALHGDVEVVLKILVHTLIMYGIFTT